MTDYDSPWKIMMAHFNELLAFFFPEIHREVDWREPVTFLDSELQAELRESMTGRLYVDKVAQVMLLSGEKEQIVLHVEAQGDQVANMTQRVYLYNTVLFQRYRIPVVSLVLYTDLHPTWRPESYTYEKWGFRLTMVFPTVKLLDYEQHEAELEASNNIFALVVLAHLAAKRTRNKDQDRQRIKRNLLRRLVQRKYSPENVKDLLKFIDWILTLPDALEKEIWQEVTQWEEVKTMYLASFEREPYQKGFGDGNKLGEKNKAVAIATALLQEGLEPSTISKVTGLSMDEIQLLIKQAS